LRPRVLQSIFAVVAAAHIAASIPAVANTEGLYVNTKPEGLAGIVYKGYFFRSPAGGEYPKRCALKLDGYCYLATDMEVTQVKTDVIKVIGKDKRPEYLCRIIPNTHLPWGECSRNGWITSPQQRNP